MTGRFRPYMYKGHYSKFHVFVIILVFNGFMDPDVKLGLDFRSCTYLVNCL